MTDSHIIFREANEDDLDQLCALTTEAFNGVNNRSIYENIFDISRDDFFGIVKDLFNQNIPSNAFSIDSYFVLSKGAELISCLAGWKEGENGIDSGRLLPMMIMNHVGLAAWQKKNDVIEKLAELYIPKEKGKIQIENMFLKEANRGTSTFFKIYFKTLDAIFNRFPECNTIQSGFYTSNQRAIRIAKHIGYTITKESSFDHPLLRPYLPNEGVVLTELEKKQFYIKNRKKIRDQWKTK